MVKTEIYKKAYGENENFISYGPEDQERAYRFKKLGYKVEWYDVNVTTFDTIMSKFGITEIARTGKIALVREASYNLDTKEISIN